MPRVIDKLRSAWQTLSEGRRVVFANVVWRMLATGVNKGVRLFVILYAANALGSASFGVYSYVISLGSTAFMFSDWGVNLLLTRDYQHAADDTARRKLASTSLFLKVGLALASTLILPVIAFVSGARDLVPLTLFFAATIAVGNLRDISISLFLSVQKAQFEFYTYLVETIALAVLCLSLFRSWVTVTGLLSIYFGATFLSAAVALFMSQKIARVSWKMFDGKLALSLLRNGLPLSLFGLTSYLFFSTDQLILKHYHGFAAVGVYNVGSKVILAVAIVPGLFNAVIFPYLSRFRSDRKKMIYIITRWSALLVSLAGGFVAAMYVVGGIIVRHFFKPEFWSIIPLLGPFAFMTMGMFAVSLFDYVLISYNLQKQDFLLTLGAAIFNVVLNLALVPHYGMAGAVAASVISQFINAFATLSYMIFAIKKRTSSYASS